MRPRARKLPPAPAAPIIEADPELTAQDARLSASGYTRPVTVHRHVDRDGLLVLRLVWRRRRAGASWTHEMVIRCPPDLLEEEESHESDA